MAQRSEFSHRKPRSPSSFLKTREKRSQLPLNKWLKPLAGSVALHSTKKETEKKEKGVPLVRAWHAVKTTHEGL